jgi:hypothetical protein
MGVLNLLLLKHQLQAPGMVRVSKVERSDLPWTNEPKSTPDAHICASQAASGQPLITGSPKEAAPSCGAARCVRSTRGRKAARPAAAAPAPAPPEDGIERGAPQRVRVPAACHQQLKGLGHARGQGRAGVVQHDPLKHLGAGFVVEGRRGRDEVLGRRARLTGERRVEQGSHWGGTPAFRLGWRARRDAGGRRQRAMHESRQPRSQQRGDIGGRMYGSGPDRVRAPLHSACCQKPGCL